MTLRPTGKYGGSSECSLSGSRREPEAQAMITLYDKAYNELVENGKEICTKNRGDNPTLIRRTMDTVEKKQATTVMSGYVALKG